MTDAEFKWILDEQKGATPQEAFAGECIATALYAKRQARSLRAAGRWRKLGLAIENAINWLWYNTYVRIADPRNFRRMKLHAEIYNGALRRA